MSFPSRWIRLFSTLLILLVAGLACRPDDPDNGGGEGSPTPGTSPSPAPAAAVSCPSNGGDLYLGCPSVPSTSASVHPQW